MFGWRWREQRSRGFGFITFAEAGSVDRVLAVAAHTLDGKKIDPKHATPKNKGKAQATSKTKKVFVGGVSQDTSADEVTYYLLSLFHLLLHLLLHLLHISTLT